MADKPSKNFKGLARENIADFVVEQTAPNWYMLHMGATVWGFTAESIRRLMDYVMRAETSERRGGMPEEDAKALVAQWAKEIEEDG